VFYCHENEPGTAGIMEGSARISRRSTPATCGRRPARSTQDPVRTLRRPFRRGRHSTIRPGAGCRFQKKGGYEHYVSPETPALQGGPSELAGWLVFSGPAVDPAGIAYNSTKVSAADAPKTCKDILNPRWKGSISCKISASVCSSYNGTTLRKLYGAGFWKEFAKQNPHAFDSRVQLFVGSPRR